MTEEITIFFQIIFKDLILAGDNAIIIGMVASKFPPEQRKKIIFWGIGGAVILRILLTLLTAYLLQITGLRLIGGLLLLYIVYKLYVDVIKNSGGGEENIKVDNSSMLKAIWTVLLADFTMSLDNVLGVAGAAKDHYYLLIFGLVLSIILMAPAATLISKWIKDYKLQMVAYAMAHNCVYGTDIDQGVILMCTPDNFFQKFTVNGSEFRELKWEWLGKVDKYYERGK